MKAADITTGVVGIVGAVGTLFISGGLSLPFVVAGLGSAIYTVGRSSYHLYDRGSHGQTLSPLDNHENFSLWLGIGANLISFGAMGATVKLSSVAFQGKAVSNSLKTLVNIINGTSLGVNSVAVANSLAYMALHFDEMSPMDVLMQVASVAFWAKSVFTYKPAATIVKDIHNQVLNNYSTAMGQSKDDFNKFRVKFNNDRQLVKFYARFLKQGLDPAQVSDVLVEIYQMGAGAQLFHVDPAQMTVNINGHTFTMEFLMSIKSCNRQTVFQILSEMDESETKSFNNLRSQLQDDVALFYLIADVSQDFELKPHTTAHCFIKFWAKVADEVSPPLIKLNKDFSITIGHGLTLNLDQIVQFSSEDDILDYIKTCLLKLPVGDIIRFNQLRVILNDDAMFFNWLTKANKMEIGNSVKVLLDLKSFETDEFEFFHLIKLEESSSSNECGMISIRNFVRVSIFFLNQFDVKLLSEFIEMIKTCEVVDDKLVNFHERVGNFRIQSEFNRQSALKWFDNVTKSFHRITSRYGKPHAYELTRLYHVKSLLHSFTDASQSEIIKFAFALNPKDFIEFCACCDFSCQYLQHKMEKHTVEHFKAWKITNPDENLSIRQWRERQVIHDIKNNCRVGKLEYAKLQMNVNRNKMFDKNSLTIKDSTSDKDLLKSLTSKVKSNNIVKFNSESVAVNQLYKRSRHDVKKYVDRANFVIKDSKSKHFVRYDQEGVMKIVDFIDANGKVEIMKRHENVYLSTFIEYDHLHQR